jgi:sugar/nucleoside kinase (ribokinase family)
MQEHSANSLMIGGIREDYCITHEGCAITGVLGGNAIYAAVGARLWSGRVSVLSRVGRNFPLEMLRQLDQSGISTSTVRILDQEIDSRTFYAYRSPEERLDTDPPSHYARWGLAFPPALKGYRSSTEGQDDRNVPTAATIRPDDISAAHLVGLHGAHLSPADYLTHLTLPSHLKRHGVETVTLDPSIRYMNPGYKADLHIILKGVTAFLPSMHEATSFIADQLKPIWDLADLFHSMGPQLIVIKAGSDGQYVSESQHNKRWHVPAYASQVRDVTGAGDAFCGAFLLGLLQTQDVLEATLRGNISASFVIEGSGALYALDTPASLVSARLGELRRMVRKA